MEVSEIKIREYVRRILTARMKLLNEQSFYGLLLMHVKMAVSERHETAWTDNKRYIYFNTSFMDSISDRELIYVLEHEVMHIVLKHVERMMTGEFDGKLYNIASDIVVNSCIMMSHGGNPLAISLAGYGGPQMHIAPDNKEGCEHTAEEIYLMLKKKYKQDSDDSEKELKKDGYENWDYHEQGNQDEEEDGDDDSSIDEMSMDINWKSWIINAAELIKKFGSKSVGGLPGLLERYIMYIKEPVLDWRVILNEFVQEEVNDYSFSPPDKRFSDSDFYLPDYNDTDFSAKKLLFMIDTSGSMSDEDISDVYSEIRGAIDQFDGKLEGWLGFFDAVIYPPCPFTNIEEFETIRLDGGGGTLFSIIFEYVKEEMSDDLPVSIIVLTDGYAPFPDEEITEGIPVLWVLTTQVEPPWGKVARINIEQDC